MNQLQHHARICKRCIVLLETVVMATLLPAVAIVSQSAQAQTFTTLHSFDNTDGANPVGGLITDAAGNLYGATNGGGARSGSRAIPPMTYPLPRPCGACRKPSMRTRWRGCCKSPPGAG